MAATQELGFVWVDLAAFSTKRIWTDGTHAANREVFNAVGRVLVSTWGGIEERNASLAWEGVDVRLLGR